MSGRADDGRFTAAVEAIYGAALSPTAWPEALHRIAAVFDDVGALLVYQREGGGFGQIVSEGIRAPQSAYQNDGWWRTDLRMSRAMERGYFVTREAITERDIVSDHELATLPFYTEFLSAYGLKWFAGVAISPDARVAAALSIQRLADKPAYIDEELARVAQLGRHVENALRLGIRLIDAEVTTLALEEILGRLGVGVFFVDDRAAVVFANPAARRLIDQGVLVGDDRLAAPSEPHRGELAAAMAAILHPKAGAGTVPPRPLLLRGRGEGDAITVYVLPLIFPTEHPVNRLFASARAVVVAVEATAGELDPSVVRDLLGLTLAEARLASLVGGGLPPKEAGGKLGITEETARTVLKRVFAKTGVSSQSQLAGLLARLVLR